MKNTRIVGHYIPLINSYLTAKGIMCNCTKQMELVDITSHYKDFQNNLILLDRDNWVKLMECSTCKQLWRIDEWDKHTLYAVKLPIQSGWESFDSKSLIKEKMVMNHGGLSKNKCIWSGCNNMQLKGIAYCINHLYETGARA